jgi:hypothetical protein
MSAAVRFALALANGTYGASLSERVLGLMREPKLPSREVPEGQYTPRLDWGAGHVLGCAKAAYKSGWGGAASRRFIAEQLAIISVNDRAAAIAVSVAPAVQPQRDDPGLSDAPAAIELVMSRMANDLIGKRCE